jgi:two-component system, cell cycle sensor histidine kinase and response regulator CckA
MRKRTSFIKLIQLWGIILLIGIGVSIVAIDVIAAYRDFNSRADQMRKDYIARQKQIIKQEVKRVVDLISYEKEQSEILTKKKVKSRTYEAYSIAQNIYQQNKTSKGKAEIQQMILDALRPIRFEYGSGYYFAIRLDGVEVLFGDKPEIKGLNLLDVQDIRGQYVVEDMVKIVRQSGEGFYEYQWTKPDSVRNDFKKISFIKRFEPYDWFIGTGLYVEDVETQIKADLLSIISRIRFEKEGYIFINRLNGDALVSNGKLFSGTKKLWEVFDKNPEEMKDIFKKEYNAALTPEGDYIYYSHIKLTTSDKESPKASFIYGIPELQWLVGSGVYLDDVETDIALMQTKINNQIKEKMLYFIPVGLAIVALYFLFLNCLNHGLKNDFNLIVSFLNSAAHSDKEIDRRPIKFVELDQMAEYANKMLTDRKQANEAFIESEKRYKAVFLGAAEGILIADIETGKFKYANPVICEMLGYTEEELKRMSVGDIYPKKALQEVISEFEAQARKEKKLSINLPCLRKDGTLIYVDIYTSPVRIDKKECNVGFFTDITERKKLEFQLLQAHKMEAIGNLAGGIAHDFNNILTSVIGFTELSLDMVEKGTHLEDNLQEVYTAGKRAKDLVRQILAFARQPEEELKPIQVDMIAAEVLKFIRSSIPTTIEIEQNIESDSLIMGNATQIHQILMNLFTNAAHAMEDKGGILEFSLKDVVMDRGATRENLDLNPGNYIEIKVSDTGTGIAPEIIGSIFDPFFTTKGPGEGTGMGLAMVHGIVKSYGGKISVDSKPGQGALFTIYLPVTRKRQGHRPYQAETLPAGTERILFVDDEAPIAKMGGQTLERFGYTVSIRTSSIEALELFRTKPNDFDLVITDMTMPNMTGDRLAVEMMKIRPDIPVILCTGFSKKISDDSIATIGIRAVAYKPIVKADLAKTVRKVLDEAKKSDS